jgi:hypothetical protein
VTALFEGLASAPSSGCGLRASEPTAFPGTPARAITPAPILSIDAWGDPTRPAPESDPCVPCTGGIVGSELQLDLSHSGSIPAGIHLDAISLRVGSSYYPLGLLPADLQEFADGGLAALVISNAAALIPDGASLSLWYRLKDAPDTDCDLSNACFWSSTPLLVDVP